MSIIYYRPLFTKKSLDLKCCAPYIVKSLEQSFSPGSESFNFIICSACLNGSFIDVSGSSCEKNLM